MAVITKSYPGNYIIDFGIVSLEPGQIVSHRDDAAVQAFAKKDLMIQKYHLDFPDLSQRHLEAGGFLTIEEEVTAVRAKETLDSK